MGRTPGLGGIQQADLPARAPAGDHIGSGAQPDPALHGASALAPAAGEPFPTARVIVQRDTPNQQPSTSWMTP